MTLGINAVINVLIFNFLTHGLKVHEFEKKYAEYVDTNYAVVVLIRTTALHLFHALGAYLTYSNREKHYSNNGT
ncbi:MAG: DegT/DnrJ/EryC1/StrS family aminotransferase [Bacteroidales bacterium]|nr:DegT/DnrJ/EryC1/StrS family aminotransferase [Bacteroidales bacterium]